MFIDIFPMCSIINAKICVLLGKKKKKKEMSKNKIEQSYNPPATSYNFYSIFLEQIKLRQQEEGQIVGLG
jgi:hypothetical protein